MTIGRRQLVCTCASDAVMKIIKYGNREHNMTKIKKRKPLVSGQRFYFIYPMQKDNYVFLEKDMKNKEAIEINHPDYVLTMGDAECYDPETDMESNCFRTKAGAKKALAQIKKIMAGKTV